MYRLCSLGLGRSTLCPARVAVSIDDVDGVAIVSKFTASADFSTMYDFAAGTASHESLME